MAKIKTCISVMSTHATRASNHITNMASVTSWQETGGAGAHNGPCIVVEITPGVDGLGYEDCRLISTKGKGSKIFGGLNIFGK